MGISIAKIIFTIAVVFLVWRLFGWIRQNRLNQANRGNQAGVGDSRNPAALEPQDTIQCAVCKAYIPTGAGNCGREDCPYPV